jgi:hypothetical protein
MPSASARAAEYVKGFRLQVALCNDGAWPSVFSDPRQMETNNQSSTTPVTTDVACMSTIVKAAAGSSPPYLSQQGPADPRCFAPTAGVT